MESRFTLISILFLLTLSQTVVSIPYFETDHDNIYLFNRETAHVYQYGYDLQLRNTFNVSEYVPSVGEAGSVTYLPDGGFMFRGLNPSPTVRYTADGDISPHTWTYGWGEGRLDNFINRIQHYYVHENGLGLYTYNTIDNDGLSGTFSHQGTLTHLMHSSSSPWIRYMDYNRIHPDMTLIGWKTFDGWSFSRIMTAQLENICQKRSSVGTIFMASEILPTLSNHNPTRFYRTSNAGQFRAYDYDTFTPCTGTPDDWNGEIYVKNLPTNNNMAGRGLYVWNAFNNRVIALGYHNHQTLGYQVSSFDMYTREGDYTAGLTFDRGNNSRFVDAMELPTGELLLLERIASENGRIVKIPITGSFTEYDLDFEIFDFHRFVYDHEIDHYRQGNQLGMLSFSAIPKDVFDYSLDPTFSSFPDWLEYTYIDDFSREVHVTISDVVIDNLPIEMLVAHASGQSHPRFSSIALDRDVLKEFNTTLLTSSGSALIPDAFAGYSESDYPMYEMEFDIALSRLASQGHVNMFIEMISPEASDIMGYSDNVSDRFTIQRWYTYPSWAWWSGSSTPTAQSNLFAVHDDWDDTYNVNNHTRIMTETGTGGTITQATLRVFVKPTGDVPYYQMRLEVQRDGARDTVTSSTWQQFRGFLPYDSKNGTINDIRIVLNDNDISAQVSYRLYGHDKIPLWTTGFGSDHSDAPNARESQAFILFEGDNTIRTYYTSDRNDYRVKDSVVNYEDWTYVITLDNATILGIDDSPFTPTPTPTDPSETPSGGSWLQPFGGFSIGQSTFIYTVLVILLTWLIIMGYSIYVANLTGASWVTSVGVVISALTSILWVFVAVFIGWLPVWVVVLLIILGAGIATTIFRRTFVTM